MSITYANTGDPFLSDHPISTTKVVSDTSRYNGKIRGSPIWRIVSREYSRNHPFFSLLAIRLLTASYFIANLLCVINLHIGQSRESMDVRSCGVFGFCNRVTCGCRDPLKSESLCYADCIYVCLNLCRDLVAFPPGSPLFNSGLTGSIP